MISGWDPRIVVWAGVLIGALALLFALPNLALWILLGLAVGLITYCYVELVREHDERGRRRERKLAKPLQNAHEWDRVVAAREKYERDIEEWMTSEELRARRGF